MCMILTASQTDVPLESSTMMSFLVSNRPALIDQLVPKKMNIECSTNVPSVITEGVYILVQVNMLGMIKFSSLLLRPNSEGKTISRRTKCLLEKFLSTQCNSQIQ